MYKLFRDYYESKKDKFENAYSFIHDGKKID